MAINAAGNLSRLIRRDLVKARSAATEAAQALDLHPDLYNDPDLVEGLAELPVLLAAHESLKTIETDNEADLIQQVD